MKRITTATLLILTGIYLLTFSAFLNNSSTVFFVLPHMDFEIDPITIIDGEIVLPEPQRSGYNFNGWYMDEECTIPYDETLIDLEDDIVIYGKFTPIQYLVTFEENGGTDVEDLEVDYDSEITLPSAPTKVGYTFEGWFLDENLSTPYSYVTMPSEDVTLYAKWSVITYDVEFIDFDGTVLKSESFEYGDSLTSIIYPTNPHRVGYTFTGWNASLPATMGLENITLTATYDVNQYTISLMSEGVELSYILEDYNTQLQAPNNPTRDGYTFDGWYSDELFTQNYTFTTMPAQNFDLYAKWIANEYLINYNLNDGTNNENNISSITTEESFQLLSPNKDGYTFDGWYLEETFTNSIQTIVLGTTSNIDLYAKWSVNQYTISFDTNGGSAIVSITQDYNTSIALQANTTKDGYTFNGWDVMVPSTMPAQNITLTAQWTVNQYTIEYLDYDGTVLLTANYDFGTPLASLVAPSVPGRAGYVFDSWDNVLPSTMGSTNISLTAVYTIARYTVSFIDHDGTVLSTEEFSYNSDLSSVMYPNNPTRAGYTFNGWESLPQTMPFNDLDIQALYTINQYTITFDSNGGTPVAAITQDFGTNIQEPTNPTKDGYSFNGWDISLPTTMPSNDLTLTAIWGVEQFTITFDSNGGTLVTAISGEFGTSVSAPTDPTRDGYTFNGWDQAIPSTIPSNNLTITAQWTINQYTMTFDANGGTAVAAITQDFGTNVSAPTNPTRDGYTFNGWDQTIPSTMPSSDLTITAQWTLNTYTISYILNGGTNNQSNPNEYTFTTSTITLLDPIKAGYTFNGWYTESTFENQMTQIEAGSTGIIVLHAKWTINQYTLTFNTNGGSSVSAIIQDYDTLILEPSQPTKDGYTFGGWYTDDQTFVNAYAFNNMPDQNQTIFAKWTINQYTISFNSNGGSAISNIIQNYATNVSAPNDPTKANYNFDGWYLDDEIFLNAYTFTTMPSENVILYAKWSATSYTITYHLDGATNHANNILTITVEDTFTLLDPIKDGYTFDGWHLDSSYVNSVITLSNITSNIDLYANWITNGYTITYVLDGGTNNNNNELAITAGQTVTLYDPTKMGYTFNGWFSEATFDNLVTSLSNVTANTTVYAKWTINQYTISFNSNGGSAVNDITQNYATNVSAPTDPTKPYSTFDGWYSDQSLTQSYTFTTMPAEDITLYAKWVEQTYTITYVLDGGTNDVDNLNQITYNQTMTLGDATKTGYSFNGWYSESTFTNQVTSLSNTTTDVTVYAKFTINQYTMTFDTGSGSAVAPITQNYATTITAPANPTQTNYTFGGWFSDVEYTNAYEITTMPAENITLYALWLTDQQTLEVVVEKISELKTTTVTLYVPNLSGKTLQQAIIDYVQYLMDFYDVTITVDDASIIKIGGNTYTFDMLVVKNSSQQWVQQLLVDFLNG